eukprot:scaffold188_cov336-Pavlova_lutheri.AAC.13
MGISSWGGDRETEAPASLVSFGAMLLPEIDGFGRSVRCRFFLPFPLFHRVAVHVRAMIVSRSFPLDILFRFFPLLGWSWQALWLMLCVFRPFTSPFSRSGWPLGMDVGGGGSGGGFEEGVGLNRGQNPTPPPHPRGDGWIDPWIAIHAIHPRSTRERGLQLGLVHFFVLFGSILA